MPPAAVNVKTKPTQVNVATQADDAKYKQKCRELKAKITEIEEDNTKLQMRVLKSKKAIQRLRVERAILYDRLQSSVTPSNPFALHTKPHLSSLPAPAPPSILDDAPYSLADPDSSSMYLKELDKRKLAALQGRTEAGDSTSQWGERPTSGVDGEHRPDEEEDDEEEEEEVEEETMDVEAA